MLCFHFEEKNGLWTKKAIFNKRKLYWQRASEREKIQNDQIVNNFVKLFILWHEKRKIWPIEDGRKQNQQSCIIVQ